MKKYNINITEEALSDMQNIYNYIAHEILSPQNAQRQYNRIAEAIMSLEEFPERYRFFDVEPEHSLGIRKMTVDNYLVCFIVDIDLVTVIAVFYGAADVHAKLGERNT